MAINPFPIQHKLFSVTEYEQMIAAGVLGEDERLELIEGEVVRMSPIGPVHVFIVNRLTNLLAAAVGQRAVVSVQNPIRLSQSQPQPDVALLLPAAGLRPYTLPSAGDILLVIEVADSTGKFDQTIKVPLYGREGISECWLIDLVAGVLEVYRGPSAGGYRTKATYAPGEVVFPQALPEVRLSVDDMIGLPPAQT